VSLIVTLYKLNKNVKALNHNLDRYVGGTIDKLTGLTDKVTMLGREALAWMAGNKHATFKTDKVEASIDIKNGGGKDE